MSRANWKWSAAIGLVIIISAAVFGWPRKTSNPPSKPETTVAPAYDPVAAEAAEDRPGYPGITEPQAEGDQLQSIARLGANLADINWRSLFDHTDRSQYPPVYDDLKSQAENGDPKAAYFLWQSLQYCQGNGPPPMTESEFAEELRMIREDHQVPQYDNGERQVLDIAQINIPTEAAVSLARLNHEQCNRMPMEHRGEAEQWKDFAVFGGSRAAESIVALELAQEGDSSALTNMWRDGDPMALNSLSGFYKQQYESGADPAGLTKSFAYWLAFRELYYASRQAAGPDMKPFFGGIEITTNRGQENLLPAQIAEAESLAKDILRNRPTTCCISLDVPK
jgi:hypothetical protein